MVGHQLGRTGFARARVAAAVVPVALAVACASSSMPAADTATGGGVSAVPAVSSSPDAAPLTVGVAAFFTPSAAPAEGAPTVGRAGIDTWSGWLPAGATFSPFDTAPQPIARLDPNLLTAIQDAASAAAAQDVTIFITSGWRSRGFQERLFSDGVRQYGSVEAAREFVASPDVSRHVDGEAVDIGGDGASEWLIKNGARFGLCQIYANEDWHFELAVDAAGKCPALLPNAAG